MKNTVKLFIVAFFILLPFRVFAVDSEDSKSAILYTKTSVDKLVGITNKKNDISVKKQQLKSEIVTMFDGMSATKFIAGKFWRNLTPAQRKILTEEYTSYLVNKYVSILSEFLSSEISYKIVDNKVEQSNKFVTVPMEFYYLDAQKTKQMVNIKLTLVSVDTSFKGFDINVEELSILGSEREQFESIFVRDGLDGVMTSIKKLNLQNKNAK
jgi:phospholipid transport system substrate-binding protein